MPILNFPPNPSPGATYTLGGATYTWTGYAWAKTNSGNINVGSLTATNITIGAGTSSVTINGGVITIGGAAVLTTSSLAGITLQSVTDQGSTTTNIVTFANTTTSAGTDSGAVLVLGGVGVVKDVWVGGRMNSESVMIADTVMDSTLTPIPDNLPKVIDEYRVDQYRSSKYLVQISDPDNFQFQSSELMMLVVTTESGFEIYTGEYGMVSNIPLGQNGGQLGVFTTQITNDVDSNVVAQLMFTAYSTSDKTVKVLRTAMTP